MWKKKTEKWNWGRIVLLTSLILALVATAFSFMHHWIIAYGDAESHLNIAKRVIQSITPGAAQLGGIWLPLPHLLMIPFIWSDFMWRSGLAGSIMSGFAFVISSYYLYKTTYLVTKSNLASVVTSIVFMSNPNILYMQSTPMTELALIMFFILSSYYFIQYILDHEKVLALMGAAFFGFCATLSRYDGWFLVLFEAVILIGIYFPWKKTFREMEGKLILFGTLAFFGIAMWMVWDGLILGDPFYFTNSQFSAKTQQQNWLIRHELPAYHNILQSLAYYFVTAMSNGGILIFFLALVGVIVYLLNKKEKNKIPFIIIISVPFIFNVVTLFLGQSVIFIPHLTPVGFEWRLFNVRYGVMLVPFIAFFVGYLFDKVKPGYKAFILFIFLFQIGLYLIGYSKVISLADGTEGLSRSKSPDAEQWLAHHYDGGLVLLDDYARSVSILRINVPMEKIIYIGNKPYWDESLVQPEKYARWIVMQKNDDVWNHVYEVPVVQGRLYKYFAKEYTSKDVLIFKRNNVPENAK